MELMLVIVIYGVDFMLDFLCFMFGKVFRFVRLVLLVFFGFRVKVIGLGRGRL